MFSLHAVFESLHFVLATIYKRLELKCSLRNFSLGPAAVCGVFDH